MNPYLADGCSQSQIDRWLDGPFPEPEEVETAPVLIPGVHPTLADTDIDDHRNGVGPELCCLSCSTEVRTRWGITATYLLACLYCPECMETVLEVWI